MPNKNQEVTNYFVSHISELHRQHASQISAFNNAAKNQDEAIKSMKRSSLDQTQTILELRNTIVEMDKELNALKAGGNAEISKASAASTEDQQGDKEPCDCPICQIEEDLPQEVKAIIQAIEESGLINALDAVMVKVSRPKKED